MLDVRNSSECHLNFLLKSMSTNWQAINEYHIVWINRTHGNSLGYWEALSLSGTSLSVWVQADTSMFWLGQAHQLIHNYITVSFPSTLHSIIICLSSAPQIIQINYYFHRVQTLSNMQASDELDDSQIRQLLHDLDSSYASFNNFLHNQWIIDSSYSYKSSQQVRLAAKNDNMTTILCLLCFSHSNTCQLVIICFIIVIMRLDTFYLK